MRCDSDMSQNAWSSVVKPRYIKNFFWSKDQTKFFDEPFIAALNKSLRAGFWTQKKAFFDAWDFESYENVCVTAAFFAFSLVLRVIEKSVNDFFFLTEKKGMTVSLNMCSFVKQKEFLD